MQPIPMSFLRPPTTVSSVIDVPLQDFNRQSTLTRPVIHHFQQNPYIENGFHLESLSDTLPATLRLGTSTVLDENQPTVATAVQSTVAVDLDVSEDMDWDNWFPEFYSSLLIGNHVIGIPQAPPLSVGLGVADEVNEPSTSNFLVELQERSKKLKKTCVEVKETGL